MGGMLGSLSAISLLWSNPFVAFGTILFFAGAIFVMYAMKFNKDPYFPFKKHQKVRVIEVVQSGNAMVFADTYSGKAGEHGIYLAKPNQILPSKIPMIKGSKEDLLVLTVTPDGIRFPAMIANIQLDDEVGEALEKLAEAKAQGRFFAGLKEMEEKQQGMPLRIFAFLRPAIETYQTLSEMVVKEFYQLEHDAATVPLNDEKEGKGGLQELLRDKNMQVLAMTAIVFIGIYLMATGALSSISSTMAKHDTSMIEMSNNYFTQQRAIIEWCAENLAGNGKYANKTVNQIYQDIVKQTGGGTSPTIQPSIKGTRKPLIDQIPQHV